MLCPQALLHQTNCLYRCLQIKQPTTLTPIQQLLLAEEKALAVAYGKKDNRSADKQKQMQTKQQVHPLRQQAAVAEQQAALTFQQQTEQIKELCHVGNKQMELAPDMPEQQQQMKAFAPFQPGNTACTIYDASTYLFAF